MRFLIIAIGSLKETEYLMDVSAERHYIAGTEHQSIQNQLIELSKMMSVFTKRIRLSQPIK